MSVPDYQSLMLPLLKTVADGNEHTLSKTIEILAHQFNLTDQDRNELLPSGKQRRFDNRVHWARTYLAKANLIIPTGRSRFRLTEQGANVLKENPSQVNIKYLERFPEFIEFKNRSDKINGNVEAGHPKKSLKRLTKHRKKS